MTLDPNFFNERDDKQWADLVSPERRALLGGGAVAFAAFGLVASAGARRRARSRQAALGY